MARLPRLSLPGIPQHIIQRGNNRQACFFSEQDYPVYLDKLKEYSRKWGVAVHSYVLMTNHVHLLVTPAESGSVSRLMQSLGSGYVRYINQRYGRSGTLWEGRYKSSLVDSDLYFLSVSRYIELNPVRAGMVAGPESYPWSSYPGNALGKPIELITPHVCYKALGRSDEERRIAYRALFERPIPEEGLRVIQEAVEKGWVLGSEGFKKRIERRAGRRVSPSQRGGDRKSARYRASVKKC